MLLYCDDELQSQSAFGPPRCRWHGCTASRTGAAEPQVCADLLQIRQPRLAKPDRQLEVVEYCLGEERAKSLASLAASQPEFQFAMAGPEPEESELSELPPGLHCPW